MNIRHTTRFILWSLFCFGALTLSTASLEAAVDGTDDYGFPLRYYRTGGNFFDILTGRKSGIDIFDIRSLSIDIIFALFMTWTAKMIIQKYRRGRENRRSKNKPVQDQ